MIYHAPLPPATFTYKFKVALGFVQIVSNIAFLETPWPADVKTFFNYFNIANLDFFQGAGVKCIATTDTFDKMVVMSSLVPVGFIAIFLFYYLPLYLRLPRNKRGQTLKKILRVKFWKLIFFTLFLAYPTVSRIILRTLVCKEINGKSYLLTDMKLQCPSELGDQEDAVDDVPGSYSDRYRSMFPFAIILSIIYPIGIPLAIAFEINKYAKRKRLTDANVMARLGFFYGGYHVTQWWFEMCDMVHKLSVTSLIFFIPYDSGYQMKVAVLILGTYMGMLLRISPYIRKSDDRLHLLAQNWLMLLVLAGEIFTYDRKPDPLMVGIMTVVLIGGFLGFLLFFLITTLAVLGSVIRKNRRCKKTLGRKKWAKKWFVEPGERKEPEYDVIYDGIEVYVTNDSTTNAMDHSKYFNTPYDGPAAVRNISAAAGDTKPPEYEDTLTQK